MKDLKIIVWICLCIFALPRISVSHELWLDSKTFQIESSQILEIDMRNGENFNGISLSFFENRIKQFFWGQNGTRTDVTSRAGDVPAMRTSIPTEGLVSIVYESTPSFLTYTNWDKFVNFVVHKDLGNAIERHQKNGWPKERFKEVYHRYSKALIGVGHSKGADENFGLETEFVALQNPYVDRLSENILLQLFYQNAPRANAQVEVFERNEREEVKVFLLRTDADGQVLVPVQSGHDYLIDSVVLREFASEEENGPLWESLWAALTFSVPEK